MAQKKITVKDRATIKKRLAQGLSYADCIKGTNVKSRQSVAVIKNEKIDDIRQMQVEYVQLVESLGMDDIERAELWVQMSRATNDKSKDAPDWQMRKEALKHIESLKFQQQQKEQGGTTQVNVFTQASKKAKEFVVEAEEV